MKSAFVLVALLLLGCFSCLFSPPPTGGADEFWGYYNALNPQMGFVVNGDAYDYVADAQRPGLLLAPRQVRQSRPLYIVAGAVAGRVLRPVAGLLPAGFYQAVLPAQTPTFLQFYAGYVGLNFAVLLGSLLLFRRLYRQFAGERGDRLVFYGLAVFLISNQITKAFFWTAHQQMFTFFTPLFCLALVLYLQRRPLRQFQLAGLALGLGLLPLVYGNFVLCLPCLWYGGLRWQDTPVGRLPGQVLLLGLLFMLPTLGWIGILHLHGVAYYNHEAERFRQLVWVLDYWQISPGAFGAKLWENLLTFLANLPAIAPFLIVAGLLALVPRRPLGSPTADRTALALVFGLFFVFFALLGYYPARLTYCLVPLLLCFIASRLPLLPRWAQRTAVLLSAVSWHLYTVLSYGPFS